MNSIACEFAFSRFASNQVQSFRVQRLGYGAVIQCFLTALLVLIAAESPVLAQSVSAYPAITGQPFHAEVKSSLKTKTQPGGKQTVQESRSVLARDSEGRVFYEQLPSQKIKATDGSYSFTPHTVSISDPLAMTVMQWNDETETNPNSKTVLKSALRPGGAKPPVLDACQREKGATRTYPNGEIQKIDGLGERTIQGILTHGCRVSTFIPAGAIHNDQPLTVTDDSWTSYEMRLTLLKLHHDPAEGADDAMELVSIVRGDPDPALFQSPPDYQVRDLEEEKRQKEQSEIAVTHPESFAGPWETRDPKSGVTDGVLLWARTELRQSAEYLTLLQIKVYRREAGATKEGWFTANEGRDATWDGKRLRLKFQPVAVGDVALDLDLVFDPAQQSWSGTFNRGGTLKQVRLRRPGALAKSQNRFDGDWFLHLDASRRVPYSATCIHVAEESDGTLVAWQDSKSPRVINAPMQNEYGREFDVQDVKFDSICLIASKWFGNQVTFSGALSPDGLQLEGHWATNGQPATSAVDFIKSSGEGFSAALSSP
ncbi:MAG TPA: hypothetical protein VK525_19280 [Candidatus Saccharimonadales bacterium]|nr:hypothetical protein [Candidatus Saccharimonadales bacterium]